MHFQLDSCIVNKGEKFGHEKDYCIHLECVHVVWDAFWEVGIFPLVTGLTGVVISEISYRSWAGDPALGFE